MPDTIESQELYPQPSGQKKGCGFPVMKFVAVFSLVTGIMLDYRKKMCLSPSEKKLDCILLMYYN
jgi:hypothetical protein